MSHSSCPSRLGGRAPRSAAHISLRMPYPSTLYLATSTVTFGITQLHVRYPKPNPHRHIKLARFDAPPTTSSIVSHHDPDMTSLRARRWGRIHLRALLCVARSCCQYATGRCQ
ncbi:hypothetical protein BDW22DRAFT_952843 [Trametopsis cervina]|nr:hypothetical protein BDW22DRAFT_952843 [Trametopsis cervina]